jgi:hypothetical protein
VSGVRCLKHRECQLLFRPFVAFRACRRGTLRFRRRTALDCRRTARGARLGSAFGNDIGTNIGAVGGDSDVIAVQQAAKDVAIANRKTAVAAVNSVRYTRLIIQFTLWVEQRGWRHEQPEKRRDALENSITSFATETLLRRHKKLPKRGRGLAEHDDETRHRARIAAKKVRYVTEFLLPCSSVEQSSTTLAC